MPLARELRGADFSLGATLAEAARHPPTLCYVILKDGHEVHRGELAAFPDGTVIPPGGEEAFTTSLRLLALVEGVYTVEFGIRYAPLADAYASEPREFRVSR